MQSSPVSNRTLEQLEAELVSFSGRLNRMEYQFLLLIREFDIRQGWKAWQFNHCAEWLNFKCGLSLGAAREKVRVARALFDLPLSSAAFEAGDLSYSKARALTRVATARTEAALLEFCIHATASQVEDHCRQLRNAERRLSTRDARQAHKARFLSRTILEDGSMAISIQLPKELADLVMKAIEKAMVADSTEEGRSESEDSTFFQQQADALVQVARGYLAGDRPSSTADHYQVMVHVDESALRKGETETPAKSDLPIESVRRLLCDASVVPIMEDSQGSPLNAGRKHRVVSPSLKRALLGRDKCCRYPGCSHDRWLDAHHVMHWVDGGETSLANTILLCSRHHRLLHEGGYTIRKNFRGEWSFRTGRGKVIPAQPVFRADHYDVPGPHASRDGSSYENQQDVIREIVPIYATG